MTGRAAYGSAFAALLLFSALLAACTGDGGDATPTATATLTPATTPTPASSPGPSESAAPPLRDLIDLARRYRGLPADSPRTARNAPYDYAIGDRVEFTILNLNGPSLQTVAADVRAVTEHAYFFVQDGVNVTPTALDTIARDFEMTVYPLVTAAFGREWSPGVDGDPRISIVHADLNGAGGYVTSADEYPRRVVARSNEREAVYLETSVLNTPGASYNALLAHELQHLISWYADPGEESWVNEGLSQVAAELAGGGTDLVRPFLNGPDNQLNTWPFGGGLHYGESQLFFRYLLDRYGGRQKASALTAAPGDGFAGIDAYLETFGITFEDVFADWLIANLVDDPSGPYAHHGADLRINIIETIGGYVGGQGNVNQFAADYLAVDSPPPGTIFAFDGADEASIGIEPLDGAFWWSNEGDAIDSRLTREFDLSGLDSATLRFRTRFDTERGWDYAYVAASTDGGETWTTLPGRRTTDYDPVEHAYGPGYSGDSGGDWLEEEIDLTPYAGDKLLLRFEYVTDDSTHGRGFAVDDIEIPELAFIDRAEGFGGWQAEGFKRVDAPLPQRFVVQLVTRDGTTVVERPEMRSGNTFEVSLDGPVTVVVSAVTRGTTERADYTWSMRRP